jgi:hypothetical protein
MNPSVVALTALAEQTFVATQATIDAMSDGQRIQLKDLVKAVSQSMSKPAKDIAGLVGLFAHNNSSSYVTRGKNGGLIKGTRPVKVVKVSKRQKKVIDDAVKLHDTILTVSP